MPGKMYSKPKSKPKATSTPWKPVITKELGPGILHGNTFISLKGVKRNLPTKKK